MLYKGYKFETYVRGFGVALRVTTSEGDKAAFCRATSSEYQRDVHPPIEYPFQIGRVERDTKMADKIIDRIESGDVTFNHKIRLNQI